MNKFSLRICYPAKFLLKVVSGIYQNPIFSAFSTGVDTESVTVIVTLCESPLETGSFRGTIETTNALLSLPVPSELENSDVNTSCSSSGDRVDNVSLLPSILLVAGKLVDIVLCSPSDCALANASLLLKLGTPFMNTLYHRGDAD